VDIFATHSGLLNQSEESIRSNNEHLESLLLHERLDLTFWSSWSWRISIQCIFGFFEFDG